MFSYLLYLLISMFLYTSFTQVKKTCTKIQVMNKQLSEKNIHLFPIIKNFVSSYIKYILTNCLQKYNLNIVKNNNKLYEIFYVIDGNTFCFKVNKKKGPSDILMITTKENNNEYDLDITDKVLMYMGPNQDFYGIQTNTKDLGYGNITFYLSNGDEKLFNENEFINL
jgi:hypothetical protein